jgi:hypothetical protein
VKTIHRQLFLPEAQSLPSTLKYTYL